MRMPNELAFINYCFNWRGADFNKSDIGSGLFRLSAAYCLTVLLILLGLFYVRGNSHANDKKCTTDHKRAGCRKC